MIQFLCPPNYATGGTEAIFACVDMLNEVGLAVEIVLCQFTCGTIEIFGESGVPDRFKKYRYSLASKVSSSAYCVVCPESFVQYLPVLKDLPIWLWWLSIDNAFENARIRKRLDIVAQSLIRNYRTKRLAMQIPTKHLCQSAYARTTLESWGLASSMLSDYVTAPHHSNSINKSQYSIAYNARRGEAEALETLASLKGRVELIPIKNMSLNEVHQQLSRSIVCLDFGFFPGKDRLVRESSLLNNVVVMGKSGSACFYEDFPLDSEYKFNSKSYRERLRCQRYLYEILEDPAQHLIAQSRFRESIMHERATFRSEVISVFST